MEENSDHDPERNTQVVRDSAVYLELLFSFFKKEIDNEQDKMVFQPKMKRLKTRVSYYDIPTVRSSDTEMDNFEIIMKNNENWAA